ncbi:MAG TPA: sulfur transferase domain-containing protein [Pyrinomonadaceae bacterium]|nr:sulfur transferase domain-containing protein [Pyrinomonadaceae bacterium]
MKNKMLSNLTAIMAIVFMVVSGAIAQESDGAVTRFDDINIINFGQMDDRLYRGGQPEQDDYADLAALGIDTVVDLRDDPTEYSRTSAEAAGLKYVHIPMSGWQYPKERDVNSFLGVVNNPDSGKIYVHCKAGKHRTGLAGAVYRHNVYGWDYDQAYGEMKKYNYTSWPVHYNIKSYVKSYYKRPKTMRSVNGMIALERAAAESN